ncbi:carbohydrate kinase family protein [Leucobacter tenebrionis]|uniref:carbohydrate kinase family protein n=1 Tax=Leucobacter tenebrionis TaxID=2873270 RepID=UPI001CA68194|nr:carbohydrate kinase [Leucobacter tenebrionis]QZY50988.1 carbohydrate kinase [Leucobacter tenebrionis]
MTDRTARGPAALVVGEALIDIVEHDGAVEEHVGGSPANVAIGLARLEHPVRLLTRLGADERARRIADALGREGVELLKQSRGDGATSTARARISADGSAEYTFDIDWRLQPCDPGPVALVHTGSIALFLEPGGSQVLELLESLAGSALVTLDPNIRPSLLGGHAEALRRFERAAATADLVKLSDEDAEWLYPTFPLEEIAERVRRLGPSVAVITLGGEGALASSSAGTVHVPARPIKVVDTISAGDSFMASLASSLLERGLAKVTATLPEVLDRAAHAAAIAVSVAGANPPLRAQLEA